jgi:hypothetical protein
MKISNKINLSFFVVASLIAITASFSFYSMARDSLQNLGNLNVTLIILAFGVTLILFAGPVTAATTFLNLGPTSPALARLVADNVKAILELEGPYNPGLTVHRIPVDAVTTSGSGISPRLA